uniref:Uncharacterized protein n=1 Tax=Cucumis melo TaxID=3656 RepID=A0A9I9E4M5_CUCME
MTIRRMHMTPRGVEWSKSLLRRRMIFFALFYIMNVVTFFELFCIMNINFF